MLLELQKCCPEVFDHLEVYVDSGIRRGADILKALCLGATAVGIGRPMMYALNYGQEGVEHLIDSKLPAVMWPPKVVRVIYQHTVLRDELETSMRMVGITDLTQVHPGLLSTLDVDYMVPATEEHPYAKWRPKPRI